MSKFPEIEGIEWVLENTPSLVKLPLVLIDRKASELGLDIVPELNSYVYCDLSKLAAVRPYYGDESEEPSKDECVAEFMGVNTLNIILKPELLLEAWKFYKNWSVS